MSVLTGKKVLLGISGGIAAYKSPLIVRLLKSLYAEVRVVMTPSAKDFVTPLALSTLSKNPVLSTFTATELDNPVWNDHVELGKWADLFIIAPATANTLSAMVNAKCNNLLIATYLSCTSPVYIAPAMDLDMYAHNANQENLKILKSFGHQVLPVGEGFLASGLHGKGRMLSPEEIIDFIEKDLEKSLPLYGKKILITAGPTYEAIDPIRFIGNHSSGKMGFELAIEASKLGAKVLLVTGPTTLELKDNRIDVQRVTSASEMFEVVMENYSDTQIAIAAAAVADFKPDTTHVHKIKKGTDFNTINLVPTKDILATMGKEKKDQFLVGFALETEEELKNAIKKLKAKNLNAIVLNSLNDKGAGFSGDQNKISFINQEGNPTDFELKSKDLVAQDIFTQILKHYA
jgi:phosphopantothenoylcysteine decarboxylase/phosphopantothenate--cysteine ligase